MQLASTLVLSYKLRHHQAMSSLHGNARPVQCSLTHACLLCSKAEPDALVRIEKEALQNEVLHLRQLLTLAGISSDANHDSGSGDGSAQTAA